jgi:hypothetical protein
MVETAGRIIRSNWPVIVAVLAGAVGYGALYERAYSTSTAVEKLSASFDKFNAGLAAETEHGKSQDQRMADVIDRVRLLELRR